MATTAEQQVERAETNSQAMDLVLPKGEDARGGTLQTEDWTYQADSWMANGGRTAPRVPTVQWSADCETHPRRVSQLSKPKTKTLSIDYGNEYRPNYESYII